MARAHTIGFLSPAITACGADRVVNPPVVTTAHTALPRSHVSASPPLPTRAMPASVGRPATRDELVAATLAAIRTANAGDIGVVIVQSDDIMGACRVSTVRAQLERRVQRVRTSLATCRRVLRAGPYIVRETRGGETRGVSPDCPGLVKLRDIKVEVVSDGILFRVPLFDPGHFDGVRTLNVGPVSCEKVALAG